MLTNFLIILKDLVRRNCVLQSFYPGYVADINAHAIKNYPALSVWFDNLVGRKEERETGLFRTFEMTCEFLVLQGYFNDNSADDAYAGELYKVRKWDELQQMSDAFFADLKQIQKTLNMNPEAPIQFLLSDVSAGTRFSRSSWLNSQSGAEYKSNQHNARIISVMQTFSLAFPLRLCADLCCCNSDTYCLPPMEIIDSKQLVKPGELKC